VYICTKSLTNDQRKAAVRIKIDYLTSRGVTVGRGSALKGGESPFLFPIF